VSDHRQIRVLPPRAAERIAAGEVVERPASVVKELIENSLDAGAHRIAVEVEGAGNRLIRVIDDGDGIPAVELPVAFQRFATSKIRSAEDLHRIDTYGFRGEALPSIAAVARVEVVTQTREAEGARIHVVGGAQAHLAPASGAPGTTVTVEDLFFNTPGRRKFVKSPAREMAVIAETVQALALAAPQVAFRLADAGRELFWYPPEDFAGRARRALGPDIARHALDVRVDEPPVTVEGVIGTPQVAQRRRTHQWFLVNGRPVRSPLLARALAQAYHTLVPRDRYPAAVLAIRLSPADVDANVHPRKAEVRFVHEGSIFNAVVAGIQRALHRVSLLHVVPATAGPDPALAPVAHGAMPLPPARPPRGAGEADWPLGSPDALNTQDADGLTAATPWPAMRILGQLARAYIVGEANGDLVLVDQHAAHERVLYERLIHQRGREGVRAQGLVAPVVLDVDARELSLLKEVGPELGAVGFEIEAFGPTAVRLVAVPAMAAGRAPAELFRACLHDLAEDRGRHAGRSLEERLAIATACHTAVRTGDALEPEMMADLLSALSRTRDPFSCFHGRPTMVRLPRSELERWFYRRA
jgi:DNA mismatch repair protein MutL